MDVDFSRIMEAILYGNKRAVDLLTWIADTFNVTFPIFLLVLIATLVFRRWLNPWARHLLWSLVLIRLILPVSVTSYFSAQILWSIVPHIRSCFADPSQVQLYGAPNANFSESLISITNHSASIPLGSGRFAERFLPYLLPAFQTLLVTGSIVVAGLTLIAFITWFGWMRYGREHNDPANAKAVYDAQGVFGVGSPVRLRTAHQLFSTAVFDWIRPTVLLHENFETLPRSEQSILLKHAVARIRRGDSGTSLLLAVVRIVHWWNPLFWCAQYFWKLERELACDALTLSLLARDQAAEYAVMLNNLVTFRSSHARFGIEAPGFMLNSGSDSILRRRIENLSRPNRLESRFQYWFSWCIIAVMAVCGLTDPAKARLQDTPIQLPPGTIWNESDAAEGMREPMEQREYSLPEKVPCLSNQFPDWTEDQIARNFEQRINSMFGSDILTYFTIDSEANASPIHSPRCRVAGNSLIVDATPTQHELIDRRLSAWESDELRQVTIEVRRISTRLELAHLLPTNGGQVIDSGIVPHRPARSLAVVPEQILRARGGATVQKPISIFVQHLIPVDVAFIADQSQRHERTNATFGPKIRMQNGTVATASSGSRRPFATSVSTSPSGVQPRIVNVAEGIEVDVFAYAHSDMVNLRLKYRVETIQEVKAQSHFIKSRKLQPQIPYVHEMTLESSAIVKSGDTLLIVPLVRGEQGELDLLLITPSIIDSSN